MPKFISVTLIGPHPKVETITRNGLFYYLPICQLCIQAAVLEDSNICIK